MGSCSSLKTYLKVVKFNLKVCHFPQPNIHSLGEDTKRPTVNDQKISRIELIIEKSLEIKELAYIS